ncbi:hypothetical protein T459_14172 [Capsicum annuum]|uniref:Uncharacterized protein n=1 Tax=Capsicum annuum TaxID=4072 RepID=A0A2G2ZGN4_CAPAN|nr:hypothetical protein T459_14172 [Capsicum annuum]
MKNLLGGNVVGAPMSSAVCTHERQPKTQLALSACEDHIVLYATSKNLSQIKRRKSVIGKMNKLGERMDCLAQGIRHHALVILSGKIAKIAFCSERSINLQSPSGKMLRMHYKVSIPISKIMKAKPRMKAVNSNPYASDNDYEVELNTKATPSSGTLEATELMIAVLKIRLSASQTMPHIVITTSFVTMHKSLML